MIPPCCAEQSAEPSGSALRLSPRADAGAVVTFAESMPASAPVTFAESRPVTAPAPRLPKAPKSASAPEIFYRPSVPGALLCDALESLSRELEPVVAALRGAQARSVLGALQAENAKLWARNLELENDSGPGIAGSKSEGATLATEATDATAATEATGVAGYAEAFPEMAPWPPHVARIAEATDLQDTESLQPLMLTAPDSPCQPLQFAAFEEASPPATDSLQGLAIPNVVDEECCTATLGPARRTSTCSAALPVCVTAPSRALVINMRRLIKAQQNLNLLHELIKSTAIAALTLVNAGSAEQLRSTAVFLSCMILIFTMHDQKWDMLEINDFKMLLPLLSDDDEPGVDNPNRLLKAMMVTESVIRINVARFCHIIGATIMIGAWAMCARWWEAADDPESMELIDNVRAIFIATAEDGVVVGMQVMVGTLMFCLHILFEAFHLNETYSVMPEPPGGGVWDPRVDGMPLRFRLFGLPSMWFTSKQALADLRYWIAMAHPTARVAEIHPQEIAYYALSGEDERREVQWALKESKLFDGKTRSLVSRGPWTSSEPESLNIELVFFDSALQNKECSFPGEFLSMPLDAADANGDVALQPSQHHASPHMVIRGAEKSTGPMALEQSTHGLTSATETPTPLAHKRLAQPSGGAV